MVTRLASLVAGVLALNAVAGSSDARAEPERNQQVTSLAADEPVGDSRASALDEGHRPAEESPSGADSDAPTAAADQPPTTPQNQTAATLDAQPQSALALPRAAITPQPPDAWIEPAASDVASALDRSPAPPAPAPLVAAPAAPVAKRARHAEPKPARPRPATALTVVNARGVPVVRVTVRVEAKTVEHARPLASHARAVVRLPKMAGCKVTVEAAYAGGEVSEAGAVDLCRERLVRLTD